MKNSILLLFAFVLALGANAQSVAYVTMTGSDTVVNTATVAVSYQVKGDYTSISLQTIITKVSGTVGGTVTIQGSLDGTNYETIDTNVVTNNDVTYTPTNVATNSEIFLITGNRYQYYRISYTGTGTMAAILNGYLLARR